MGDKRQAGKVPIPADRMCTILTHIDCVAQFAYVLENNPAKLSKPTGSSARKSQVC